MPVYYHNDRIIRQRLAQNVALRDGLEIEIYDRDNRYPQRMKQIRLASPLVVSATKVLTDFINGDGFENGDTVVNADGQTINDILDLTTVDTGSFKNSMALMLDFNALGEVVEIQYLSFEFVRFGRANEKTGRHSTVLVSRNWERDRLKGADFDNVQKFKLFNPLLAPEDIIKGAKGTQILYITAIPDEYSLATFDPVADAAQTDSELQIFELNTVSKGFAGVTMWKIPGGWNEGSQEETDIKNKAKDMEGGKGGGIVVVGSDEDDPESLLETIPADNKDRLFDLTTQHVRDIISQNYNQPGALSGVNPEGGVFTQQAFKDAFKIYNSATKNERNRVQRAYQKVMDLWHEGPVDLGKIIPQEFEGDVIEEKPIIPEEKDPKVIPLNPNEPDNKNIELNNTYGSVIG